MELMIMIMLSAVLSASAAPVFLEPRQGTPCLPSCQDPSSDSCKVCCQTVRHEVDWKCQATSSLDKAACCGEDWNSQCWNVASDSNKGHACNQCGRETIESQIAVGPELLGGQWYEGNQDPYLMCPVLFTIDESSLEECAASCSQTLNCESINFKFTEPTDLYKQGKYMPIGDTPEEKGISEASSGYTYPFVADATLLPGKCYIMGSSSDVLCEEWVSQRNEWADFDVQGKISDDTGLPYTGAFDDWKNVGPFDNKYGYDMITVTRVSKVTASPTTTPTATPTETPTETPTASPTTAPSASPTSSPTAAPTETPPTPCEDQSDCTDVFDSNGRGTRCVSPTAVAATRRLLFTKLQEDETADEQKICV